MHFSSFFIIVSMFANLIACGTSSHGPKPSQEQKVATSAATTTPTSVPKIENRMVETVCERGPEKRNLDIESVLPAGCKLWYSRLEIRNVVASSSKGNGHCEQIRDRIQQKLEAAQFKCVKKSE